MGKEIASQVQESQSPKQDKPKMKHPKTHINQINKDQTQRANIKSSKGKQQVGLASQTPVRACDGSCSLPPITPPRESLATAGYI